VYSILGVGHQIELINEAAGRVMTRMGTRYQRFTLMLTMAEEQATVRVVTFESPDAPDPRMQKCIFLSLLSMLLSDCLQRKEEENGVCGGCRSRRSVGH
jgi:hypothetical protein